MNWDSIVKAVSEFRPPFEHRVFVFIAAIVLLLIVNGAVLLVRGFMKSRKSKKGSKKAKPKVLVDKMSGFNFLKTRAKESRILKIAGIVIRKLTRPFVIVAKFFWRKKLLFFNIFLVFIAVGIAVYTFVSRPLVIYSSPASGRHMKSGDQVIEIDFDLPFDPDKIKFNISPDIEGKWETVEAIPGLPWKRKVRFYPDESIYPGEEVVVYIVGLRSWWKPKKLHEQAVEFKSPEIPDIEDVFPENEAENIPTDSNIEFQYDAPLGDFVQLTYEISPESEVEYKTKEEKGIQEIDFEKSLSQDQEYTVEVYRTLRSYDVETGEDIKTGETEKIESLKFKTVTTPSIESYEPKGDGAHADSVIKIVFAEKMNRKSVESKFSINPEVEGEISWEDDRTFVLTPASELPKETDFEMKLEADLKNKYGGTTPEEIKLNFKTIGKVGVVATSPLAGAYGIDPKSTNIVIEFNQEVDHESAQQKFSISPGVGGGFSWNGNQLIYSSAGNLSYSTRYTVKVAAGVKTIYGIDSDQDHVFTFTTRDNVFALNVPWYRQQESFTCNIAATRMALAYRGVYVSESQIKSSIGIGDNPNYNWVPGYGVHWGPIASYIGNFRGVAIKSGWNVPELAREVEKGNPVILWWYNRYSQPAGAFTLPSGATGYMGMHSEVVRGFVGDAGNPVSLLTNDPWRGRLTYSRSLFTSTWAYLGYTAVVVY